MAATAGRDRESQDAAAMAANMANSGKARSPLDADNKLSSASAAMSLKRAQPQDLPSFPSTGIANRQASAGAAASLAFAEQKPFEHWKPEQSHPAGKAALLANDTKGPELWQPEASVAGSKAALLAHKNTTGVNIWKADSTAEGSSAAGIAMRSKAKVDKSTSRSSNQALGSTRTRAASIPVSYAYPDSVNSASNALKAATKASTHPKQEASGYNDLPGFTPEEAARIHKAATTNMDRAMYTSAPPVEPEVEEKNRQAGLRAAAVSMAKNMMLAQEKAAAKYSNEDGQAAAEKASQGRNPSVEVDRREAALQYLNLQDAAKKLAAERLAKINNESEEYRQYYGAFSPAKSRMSLRVRRRSSSDAQLDTSDKARSEKIRSEMSMFSSELAKVDAKKRQSDRDALLAAAKRNVENNMKGLDEQVFQETGKASPAMKAQWEAAAREKAEKDSKARMENYGKVHIGGGVYMDQSEVNAIAAAKVQPTLDEVTRKAEAQRALDEQRRQEAEEQRRLAEEKAAAERERNRQTKETWNVFKAEEKEKKRQEKEQDKQRKEEEEIKQIYANTAAEQDRKARAAKETEAKEAAAKEEQEHDAKLDSTWNEFKENEKKQKEEEKARKNQDKRKSRLGSMFASMGFGEKEKKDEPKDSSRSKFIGGSKFELAKADAKSPESSKTEGKTENKTENKTETKAEAQSTPVKSDPDSAKNPEFESETKEAPKANDTAAIASTVKDEPETSTKDPVSEENTTTTVMPALPESESERLALAEAIYVPTDIQQKKSPETSKPVAPSSPSSATKVTNTSPTQKQEREESKQSWFKRKFSRSGKEGRPQPGTISKLKQSQGESSKAEGSRTKDFKISAPIVIGSSAIATSAADSVPSTAGTASSVPPVTEEHEVSDDPDGSAAIAAASALPSHMSTVHRSDTETNLSERDVALAGKEDQQPLVSPVTATPSETGLDGRAEPVTTRVEGAANTTEGTQTMTRSRSTSISSLASDAPSETMRGAASAALAASEHLDAEEALRLHSGSNEIRPLDTSRTSESQEFFQDSRQDPETPSASAPANAKKDLRSVSASSGPRETKFHEEL